MTTSYMEKVRRIRQSNLVGYWPLNENDLAYTYDWGPNAYNASATAVTPANRNIYGKDGGPCFEFDGSTSYVDIYAALASAITTIGTVSVWMACDKEYLDGTTLGRIFTMSADTDNALLIEKTATANTFRMAYIAGGTTVAVSPTIYSAGLFPEWRHLAITMTVAGDAVKVYVDGLQSGSTQTTLGTWSGAVASTLFTIGSGSTVPANVFKGWLQHCAMWNAVLTDDEIADLAKSGP